MLISRERPSGWIGLWGIDALPEIVAGLTDIRYQRAAIRKPRRKVPSVTQWHRTMVPVICVGGGGGGGGYLLACIRVDEQKNPGVKEKSLDGPDAIVHVRVFSILGGELRAKVSRRG